jgi:hypothetical protein
MEEPDHEPEPIDRSEVDPRDVDYVCDFCGGRPVAWAYPTETEITSVLATPMDTGRETRKPLGRSQHRPDQLRDRTEFERVTRLLSMLSVATSNYSAVWCACEACGQAIELGDLNRLVTHVRRVREDYARLPRRLFTEHYRPFMDQRKPRYAVPARRQQEE